MFPCGSRPLPSCRQMVLDIEQVSMVRRELRYYLQWDVGTWSKALLFWDERLGESLSGLECLELGCGSGSLSLWAARRGASVICSDLRDTARRTAKTRRRPPGTGSLRAEDLDAISIPYRARFDIVLFKSILGGIGRNGRYDLQQQAIRNILNCLKPGGYLLFAENTRGSKLHVVMRRRFVRWGRAWRYVTLDEMHQLLSGFSSVEMRTCGFFAAFGVTERLREVLARMDSLFVERLVPGHLHYVLYGIARKPLEET